MRRPRSPPCAASSRSLGLEAFERGLTQVDWPARLQNLVKGHVCDIAPKGAEIWLDGGHNEDGGRALAEAMADFADRTERPLIIYLRHADDQGHRRAFLRPFKGLAQEVLAVPVKAEQYYGKPARDVAAAAEAEGLKAAACESTEAALRFLSARESAAPAAHPHRGQPLPRRRGAGAERDAAEIAAGRQRSSHYLCRRVDIFPPPGAFALRPPRPRGAPAANRTDDGVALN